MDTAQLLTFALAHYPHAISLLAGYFAKPGWRKARAAFVLMCRAVVAHDDGKDAEALKDVESAAKMVLPPIAEAVATAEHGTLAPAKPAPWKPDPKAPKPLTFGDVVRKP